MKSLMKKIILSKKNRLKSKNEIQPPRNTIQVKALINIIELYSAKKNKAKPILEYSTLNPETNSLSASGRSNGALFVSANILIKNISVKGNKGKTKKQKFCVIIISTRFNDPTKSKTVIKIKPIEIS
jgi:hypothetical protein